MNECRKEEKKTEMKEAGKEETRLGEKEEVQQEKNK